MIKFFDLKGSGVDRGIVPRLQSLLEFAHVSRLGVAFSEPEKHSRVEKITSFIVSSIELSAATAMSGGANYTRVWQIHAVLHPRPDVRCHLCCSFPRIYIFYVCIYII